MGDGIHHRHGSARRSVRACILHLGAILFTGTIPPVEVPERANNDRFVHAVRRDVHLLLVSASLFSSCYQSQQHTNTPETSTWNSYFGSYLQVVNRLDITTANYVLNAFSLTSFIFSPIFGL